jgi:hypothetical protein
MGSICLYVQGLVADEHDETSSFVKIYFPDLYGGDNGWSADDFIARIKESM